MKCQFKTCDCQEPERPETLGDKVADMVAAGIVLVFIAGLAVYYWFKG